MTEMRPTTPPKPATGPTEPPPGLLTAARAAVQLEPQRSFSRWASVVDAAQTAASLRRVRVRSNLRRWFLVTVELGASRRSAARTAETHRFVRYPPPAPNQLRVHLERDCGWHDAGGDEQPSPSPAPAPVPSPSPSSSNPNPNPDLTARPGPPQEFMILTRTLILTLVLTP